MSWGGLNPALTQFRRAVMVRFPKRGTQSDGGYADAAHGSSSQHQPDADGSVDAFDMDVNFLGSSVPTGNATEKRILAAVLADFRNDPHDRAQVVISNRKISNRDIDDWRERTYDGDSPHDHHAHCQSRPENERDGRPWPMPRTDALIRELNGEDVTPAELNDAICKALETERGQAAIGTAAGRGVHSQKLFRSDRTIGQDLYEEDPRQLLGPLQDLIAQVAALNERIDQLGSPPTEPADPPPAEASRAAAAPKPQAPAAAKNATTTTKSTSTK